MRLSHIGRLLGGFVAKAWLALAVVIAMAYAVGTGPAMASGLNLTSGAAKQPVIVFYGVGSTTPVAQPAENVAKDWPIIDAILQIAGRHGCEADTTATLELLPLSKSSAALHREGWGGLTFAEIVWLGQERLASLDTARTHKIAEIMSAGGIGRTHLEGTIV